MLPKAEQPGEYVGEVRGRSIKINSELVFVKFPSSAAQREPRRAPYGLCLPLIGQTCNPAICPRGMFLPPFVTAHSPIQSDAVLFIKDHSPGTSIPPT